MSVIGQIFFFFATQPPIAIRFRLAHAVLLAKL
jgi:hypothetical protein